MGVLALAGFGFYRYVKRGRVHRDWAKVLGEAAERVNGRASLGGRFDSPQLRTTIDGVNITISFKNAHKKSDHATAIAEAKLELPSNEYRLYFAWNVVQIREELKYIPEIDLPFGYGLPSPHIIRANDSDFAQELLKLAANDIVDVMREANAHGLEFLLRAGGLRMAVHGIERSPWMVERIATATARIARGVRFCVDAPDADGDRPLAAELMSAPKRVCSLCAETAHGDEILCCNRCQAAYHKKCWRQATGCIQNDCFETRATPL